MEPSSRTAIIIGPMGVGQAIDAGIALTRRHYRQFVLTCAWAIVPAFVLGAIFDLAPGNPRLGSLFIVIAVWFANIAFVIAGALLIRSDHDETGLRPGELYRQAWRRVGRAFLFTLLIAVMIVPLIVVFPLGIYLGIRWSMAWVAIIIEGDGPIQGLRRSWGLTVRAWWHTLGVLIVAFILYGLAVGAVTGVFSAAGFFAISAGSPALGGVVVNLGSAISSIFVAPFYWVIYVVVYYELRARQEGFDLESRARQLWQPPIA